MTTLGFVLHFAVLEKIVTPPDFTGEEYSIGFDWNQPYLSFNPDAISAPYAFYLHFEQAGVERALELNKFLLEKTGELPSPRGLRACFGRRGAEHFAAMISGDDEE